MTAEITQTETNFFNAFSGRLELERSRGNIINNIFKYKARI